MVAALELINAPVLFLEFDAGPPQLEVAAGGKNTEKQYDRYGNNAKDIIELSFMRQPVAWVSHDPLFRPLSGRLL